MRWRPAAIALLIFLAVVALLASSSTAAPVRGTPGDLWADIVIGQPSFDEASSYSTIGNHFDTLGGVSVVNGNLLLVADARHCRLEGFNWQDILAGITNPQPTVIYGEPDANTSACNGDSNFQNYPTVAAANAQSQRGVLESQVSISEGGCASSPTANASHVFYFDCWNNRVESYPIAGGQADFVWGQDDFTGTQCNKGHGPDATTLCYNWGPDNDALVGVELDATGIWVTDNGNNRVVHFPFGSKAADVVLGQGNFVSGAPGNSLSSLSAPNIVRLAPDGRIYVSDEHNSRVQRFPANPQTGAAAETFAVISRPTGIRLDPTRPGFVWLLDSDAFVIELWDTTSKLTSQLDDVCVRGDANLCGAGGGRAARDFAIDGAGNLALIPGYAEHSQQLLLFKKGASQTVPQTFFTNNPLTASDLGWWISGVAVASNQLIVAERSRLVFWNNLSSLTNHKPADGYAGNFGTNYQMQSFQDQDPSCCSAISADRSGHVWIGVFDDRDWSPGILGYSLPLTTGAVPSSIIRGGAQYNLQPTALPVLGGGTINLGIIWGLAANSDSSFLWVADTYYHRVLRIRSPLSNPVVDVILGHTTYPDIACNQGGVPTALTLCFPGSVSLDRLGNLWVGDSSLEIQGNMRLLEYDAALFPTNNATALYAIPATRIIPNIASWQTAFDSTNRLVAGVNNYFTGGPLGTQTRFPIYMNNPLAAQTIDGHLQDYGSPFSAAFDDTDNLYVGDINRGNVHIYLNPFNNNAAPTPTPVNTAQATPTATPIPIFTPTPGPIVCHGHGQHCNSTRF